MKRTGDECDQCGRQIQFASTKATEHPGMQFCSMTCAERYRRDVSIFDARMSGETEAEVGLRLNLRRSIVRDCYTRHQARMQGRDSAKLKRRAGRRQGKSQ